MRINALINDAANHVKRIEVIRPRGNAVVFDFAWDDAARQFKAVGTPVGMDAKRLYVLRDTTPANDADLSYQLMFASGIIHTFGGSGLVTSVSDAGSGLQAGVSWGTGQMALPPSGTGNPSDTSSGKYTMTMNWSKGTIASVDYATKLADSQTIRTTLGYAGASDPKLTALDKSDEANEAAIDEFSYAVSGGTITSNGVTIERTGTFAGGTVTLKQSVPGDASVLGYVSNMTTFNSNGLVASSAAILSEDGTAITTATTTYNYQGGTDRYANGAAKWGKVSGVTYNDGSWEQLTYAADTGWLASRLTPFKDSGTGTGAESAGNLAEFSYLASDAGGGDIANERMLTERARKITSKTANTVTGITFNKYRGQSVTTSYAKSQSDTAPGQPDLRSTTTVSGFGNYSVQAGAYLLTQSFNAGAGTSSGTSKWGNTVLSSGSSTFNPFGGLTSSSGYNVGASDVSINQGGGNPPTTDRFGRTLSVTASNGLTSSVQSYDWFGPTEMTGPDNVPVTLTYTPLGQIKTSAALGVTTTYGYDAGGNTISVTRASAGSTGKPALSATVSATWDVLGRMTSYTDELGTKNTYVYDDSTHTITTTYDVTHPTTPARTEVDSFYLDGALKDVSGTAVIPTKYDEGVDSNGDTWNASSIDNGTTWSKSFSNMLGQNYKQTVPTSDGGTATATTSYDISGRVSKSIGFDGTVVDTKYGANGLPASTIVRTPGGADRKTSYQYFNDRDEADGNRYSGVQGTAVSSSGSVTSIVEERDGGLFTRQVDNAAADGTGLVTTRQTTLGTGIGEATILTTFPDGTKVRDTYANNVLTLEEQLATNGTVITSQTFGYDSFYRNLSSTDPVFGTTSRTLRLDGSVNSTTMPGHSASTVNTQDNTTGTPKDVTRADGTSVTQDVNLLGQVTKQDGAGLTPATFGYDGGTGQLKNLKLYPSGNTNDTTGMQETKWDFNAATGALTKKTFADVATDPTDVIDYTYTGVKLSSIAGQGLTTTPLYNTVGETIGSINEDTATHQKVTDKIESQDDQGRPTVITGVTTEANGTVTVQQTNSLIYSNGKLTDESQAAGVTVHYDYYPNTATSTGSSPGAIQAMKLMQGGSTISETDYAYDPTTKRLDTITVKTKKSDGTFEVKAFTIGYLNQTNVINTVTADSGPRSTWTYDTATGRLQEVSTVASVGATSSLYTAIYGYNANDQRQTENVTQSNPDATTHSRSLTYTYDGRDQLQLVTDNNTGDSPYAYYYDGVGNRTNTTFGTLNSLNQYSTFTYNSRGDLTDDGTFTYTWNAKDRLTAVTAKDNSVKVAFQYDGQGRRIRKDVYSWDNGSSTWTLYSTRKFVYDGRGLVAETDGANTLLIGYTWGPKGLLSVTDNRGSAPKVYMAVLDGAGNVAALINSGTGAVAATYRYDPYGKLISEMTDVNDPAASSACSMLWGQGYMDRETGLVYLDHRYLSPVQGRFISRDPIGETGGLNTSVYCYNDPLNFSDPSGFEAVFGSSAQMERTNIRVYVKSPWSGGTIGWAYRTGLIGDAGKVEQIPFIVGTDDRAYKVASYQFTNTDKGWDDLRRVFDAYEKRGMPFSEAAKDLIVNNITSKGRYTIYVPGTTEIPEATRILWGEKWGPSQPKGAEAWIPLWASAKGFYHDLFVGNYGNAIINAGAYISDCFLVRSLAKGALNLAKAGANWLFQDAAEVAAKRAALEEATAAAVRNLERLVGESGSRRLDLTARLEYGINPAVGLRQVEANIAALRREFEAAGGFVDDTAAKRGIPGASYANNTTTDGVFHAKEVYGLERDTIYLYEGSNYDISVLAEELLHWQQVQKIRSAGLSIARIQRDAIKVKALEDDIIGRMLKLGFSISP